MNPTIAKITCPLCGNDEATVHRQKDRKKKLYYRCTGATFADGCGTIQCTGASGQAFISKNMKPLNGVESEDAAIEAAEDAKAEQVKPNKKRSFLDFLVDDE
ncbi:protein P14 [Pseudoalteromonas phage PM2]|uniref:Uncharacterized protein P14 n=1 Tax=Pseudoalteromonas phage PM2 TaxID=2905728 RepID=P14_BPPM2|nr:protein P14 [Pseudoalteromonas phage PM2]Q9XJS1.1 RecName: Full=Uncharacterized protein P14; AltName: Full=Protein XIV [Pseudoalteromonas phage PM2]AAD43545.1 protein P14 [Pseudoalteromonas phage PM2]